VFVVGSIAILAFAEPTSVMLGLPQLLLPLMLVTVAGQIVESLMTQIAIHDQRGDLLLRSPTAHREAETAKAHRG